jgi:hypothetical protein
MQYKPNRTVGYMFTIDMDNVLDHLSLMNLKDSIKNHNDYQKNLMKKHPGFVGKLCKVNVRYRKPLLNHPDSGRKYGFGGSVRLDQNPTQADVYVKML